MSVCIRWSDLWTYGPNAEEHVPLDRLENPSEHIHGCLEVEIAGKALPSLGYFGPDDVCLNTWIEVLFAVVRELTVATIGTYTFDEGEQGQPTYEFTRDGEHLFVSVSESLLSGASGDPDFQRVKCRWSDFTHEVARVTGELECHIKQVAGDVGHLWWEGVAENAI